MTRIFNVGTGDEPGRDAHAAQLSGATLKCGTNCGSCIPELKKVIAGQIVGLSWLRWLQGVSSEAAINLCVLRE